MVDLSNQSNGWTPRRQIAGKLAAILMLVAAIGIYISRDRAQALAEMSRAETVRNAPRDRARALFEMSLRTEHSTPTNESCESGCPDVIHCDANWVHVSAGTPTPIRGSYYNAERRHGGEYTQFYAVLKPADAKRQLSAQPLRDAAATSREQDDAKQVVSENGVLWVPFSPWIQLRIDSGAADVALFAWSCSTR